mgnify:CR=1 FL=1
MEFSRVFVEISYGSEIPRAKLAQSGTNLTSHGNSLGITINVGIIKKGTCMWISFCVSNINFEVLSCSSRREVGSKERLLENQ